MGWTRFYESTFKDDFSGHPELKKYWNNEAARTESGAKSLRGFEVSYFDSGLGLVSRYTGKPVQEISLEDERGALLRPQHKSTSKSQTAAGEGLPLVLQELRQIGGLMRKVCNCDLDIDGIAPPLTNLLSNVIDFSNLIEQRPLEFLKTILRIWEEVRGIELERCHF
jgi:hypothetical protein